GANRFVYSLPSPNLERPTRAGKVQLKRQKELSQLLRSSASSGPPTESCTSGLTKFRLYRKSKTGSPSREVFICY
ncbi:hypothetical protein GCK32_007896, partial [Trichostrongylus colubriformis]